MGKQVHKAELIPGLDGTMDRPFVIPTCGTQAEVFLTDDDRDVTCKRCKKRRGKV